MYDKIIGGVPGGQYISSIVPSATGPIAASAEDCMHFFKALSNPNYLKNDSRAMPIPFDTEAYEKFLNYAGPDVTFGFV
eukprot:CAMPEP_0202961534 /NCGR_PEP_ID=MMETSP1396-20130829/5591_1 /ASSEMBLY_ACC=CAM_ASM_000872 /TAXON_ID= /ORGANISM="Pseudokeronopsis sp., Strain Brazil" /LENGTH=78 /DNA_ID=CAMNT_0049681417 /DNA_START=758 /DNA_END=994 /DNA_ORIENTATION=-